MCASGAAQQSPRRAPGFSLPDTKQQQHDLQDYRGKWVVLDFMKTDCPHCNELTPVLEKAKAKYAGQVAVLSVVMAPDSPQNVTDYIKRHKMTSPVLFDCGQVAFSYIRPSPANPAVTLPHVFIVDPQGRIARDIPSGPAHEEAAFLAALDKLIAPAAAKPAAVPKKK